MIELNFKKLESFISHKMSETNLPGISLRVIKDDDIQLSRGFGFRNIEKALPANEKTSYAIASITKSFTALSIMQLKERGMLDVNDPVSDYLPSLEIKPKGEPIRLKHLLNHTSGIPALGYSESFIKKKVGAGKAWLPLADTNDMIDFINGAKEWVYSEPGERFFYSNEGYILLGAIVKKISGISYKKYVKENIFTPLEMERSFFDRKNLEDDQNLATPYILSDEGEQISSIYPTRWLKAHGGIRSNVVDLSRYLKMYLNGGKLGKTRIVTEKSLEEMKTFGVPTPSVEGSFGESGYGYGLGVIKNFFGHRLISHSGSILVSTGYIGFIPEKNIGISLLANGSGYSLSYLGMYGLALALGQDPKDCPFIFRETALEELEGIYETYRGTMKAQVKEVGDLIEVKIKDKYNEDVTQLIPEDLGEDQRIFYYLEDGNKIPVQFELGTGKINLIFERYRLKKVD